MSSSSAYTLPSAATPAVVASSSLAKVTDHGSEATNLLIHFFRDKPRWAAVCAALSKHIQKQENIYWYYYTTCRDIDSAGGVHLDRLGGIVREPRSNRTDAEYRRVIAARVLTNRSTGKIPELYAIADALTNSQPSRIEEFYPAAMIAYFESGVGTALASDVVRMMRQAKPAGVRLDLVVVPTGGALFGSSTATPVGSLWGSSTGTPVGSLWSGIS